jgi:YD repeat-containing protein
MVSHIPDGGRSSGAVRGHAAPGEREQTDQRECRGSVTSFKYDATGNLREMSEADAGKDQPITLS